MMASKQYPQSTAEGNDATEGIEIGSKYHIWQQPQTSTSSSPSPPESAGMTVLIVCSMLWCVYFGRHAWEYYTLAKRHYSQGAYSTAEDYKSQAKKSAWIGIAIGLTVTIVFLGVLVPVIVFRAIVDHQASLLQGS